MFGIGPLELMVILVLALIVFGPEKLPELMRSAGHAIREFQRYSQELTTTFHETTAEFTSAMDVSDVTEAVQEAVQTVNGAVHDEVPTETYTYATPPEPEPIEVRQVAQYSEYDTAAAMLDPVKPFVEPAPPLAAQADPPPDLKPKRGRKKPVPQTDVISVEAAASEPI